MSSKAGESRRNFHIQLEVMDDTPLQIADAIRRHMLLPASYPQLTASCWEEIRIVGEALISEYKRYQNLKETGQFKTITEGAE